MLSLWGSSICRCSDAQNWHLPQIGAHFVEPSKCFPEGFFSFTPVDLKTSLNEIHTVKVLSCFDVLYSQKSHEVIV